MRIVLSAQFKKDLKLARYRECTRLAIDLQQGERWRAESFESCKNRNSL